MQFQSTPLSRGATVNSELSVQNQIIFQSTPLSRGATLSASGAACAAPISIHAPLARGDPAFFLRHLRQPISIHAPLARGDPSTPRFPKNWPDFNPRPSREGRLPGSNARATAAVFQSTPLSRGATRIFLMCQQKNIKFQSTPLSRGATAKSNKTIARFSSFYIKTSDPFCFCTFADTKKFSKQVLSGCEPSNKC